ncbi:MAG: hypothetical protein NZV14_03850 [Bryobacteraceae bacterium]|nr:hypothetical protein [Bryobacteraceae bacterium]MDW8377265.1 hypothetical protein [Bryobacterales bacterium]
MTSRLMVILATFWMSASASDVFYLLWFDTEDFIEPAADDAAMRLALELEKLGVRATFKIVGEKARMLEQRGRTDVIRALARHDIGYHAENHSIPPTPAVYLKPLGLLEGAEEFERREGQGVADIRRIFGVTPSCYGQPGSSWGPQSNLALRRMGIPVYMDEGSHIGLHDQPFWYGGILYCFRLNRNVVRAELDDERQALQARTQFDEALRRLRQAGGGVIQTYYHPTEFVTTEFWDAVNFSRGRFTAPSDYRRPKLRTKESMEKAYRLFFDFIRYVKASGVRFATGRDLPQLMEDPNQPVDVPAARKRFVEAIDIQGRNSAADVLLALLGFPPTYVDGPTIRVESTVRSTSIPRELFLRGKQDAISYIERHRRLPSHVWFGSERLSLADFAATLAGDDGGPAVSVRRGKLAFERHVNSDPEGAFQWIIHPEGFAAPELLELARLQAWTLKPAKLK